MCESCVFVAGGNQIVKEDLESEVAISRSISGRHEGGIGRMSLRREFETLLDSGPLEEELHQFIAAHPHILTRCVGRFGCSDLKSKVGIHKYEMDFALCQYWDSADRYEYTIVEIERSTHRLFTAKGDPSAALTHALRQVVDWRGWIEDNLAYARKILPHIEPTPAALVIIGRRASLTSYDQRRLGVLTAGLYRTRIHTFDRLLDNCVADA